MAYFLNWVWHIEMSTHFISFCYMKYLGIIVHCFRIQKKGIWTTYLQCSPKYLWKELRVTNFSSSSDVITRMIIYHLTSKIDTGCTQHYQRMPGIQIYGALRKYSKKIHRFETRYVNFLEIKFLWLPTCHKGHFCCRNCLK